MATERVAVDTNILVYAFGAPDPKGERATQALGRCHAVSVQALNEFTDVMRRKYRRDFADVELGLRYFTAFLEVLPMTEQAREMAFDLARGRGLRIYDAMIVATAAEAGCTVLLSEDLGHGESHLGVRVENPFRTA